MLTLWVVLGITLAERHETMTPKPDQTQSKASSMRPVRKIVKGATETGRMFIPVDELIRRTQTMSLSRYIE